LVVNQLRAAQQEEDCTSLRDLMVVTRLREDDRQASRKLWADVADTLARDESKASPDKEVERETTT
jgi:hypothetical protein